MATSMLASEERDDPWTVELPLEGLHPKQRAGTVGRPIYFRHTDTPDGHVIKSTRMARASWCASSVWKSRSSSTSCKSLHPTRSRTCRMAR